MDISTPAQKLLIRCLAAYEAPWLPLRNVATRGPFRAAQLGGGVRLIGDAMDGRQRKVLQRDRQELVDARLMLGLSLTPDGRRLARQLTWPHDADELIGVLQRIIERKAAGDCRPDNWVPESLVCGHPWGEDSAPFYQLESLLLPALADRIAESAVTTSRHAFYRLAETPDPDSIDFLVHESVGYEPDKWRKSGLTCTSKITAVRGR